MIEKTLGHYRVGEQLGRGGMGEVYLADDINLNRKVALKFLPEAFATDPERMARFEREAKMLASLNHPNIAAIFGLEQADGKRFLVLELVEGETLAQKLRKGPLSVEEALGVCRQIAEGLEAAHEKGVIHRDLKPANVMIAEGDRVKILDFGLAKALSDETQSVDSSQSPTLTEAMTRPGVILGTAAYMSPEQAKGKSVDKRADIWAYGCILYECLTGKRAFEGETVTETLAAVLTREPEWEKAPAKARPLLRRCLERDPKRRLRDLGDAVLEPELATMAAPVRQPIYRQPLMWALALIAVAALVYALWNHPSSVPRTVVRFSIPLPPDQELTDCPAISPDGQTIAYILRKGTEEQQLYLRRLDSFGEPRPVIGSAGAMQPFFSPDGKEIAFFAKGKLQKAEVSGGNPTPIADAPYPFGGTWNQDGTIIFTTGLNSGLLRISAKANGGTPESLTKPDGAGQGYAHAWPKALPDGHSVLFTIWGEVGGYAVLSLDSRQWQIIKPGVVSSVFCPSAGSTGHLLSPDFNAGIKATAFDFAHPPDTSSSGDTSVLGDVYLSEGNANSWLAVSKTGTVVYAQGNPTKRSLVWVGIDDRKIESLSTPQARYNALALAPDGSRVLASDWLELFIYNPKQPTRIPVTPPTTNSLEANAFPLWSLDNNLYFSSNRGGDWDIYKQPADGSQPAEVLLKRPLDQMPSSIGRDGTLLFYGIDPKTGEDIWALPPDGKPTSVLATPYNEESPSLSPDGQWIAYASDESGKYEIYVMKYRGEKRGLPVSQGFGTSPRWSHDGKKIFYISGDTMMMVPMRPDGTRASKPSQIFDCSGYKNNNYEISPDDKRFLMIRPDPGSVPRQLNVILNWPVELDRQVPVGEK